jgi:hypothetical protein
MARTLTAGAGAGAGFEVAGGAGAGLEGAGAAGAGAAALAALRIITPVRSIHYKTKLRTVSLLAWEEDGPCWLPP